MERQDDTQGAGPAAEALRAYLRTHRPRLPPILRACLVASVASAAAMLSVIAAGFITDVQTGWLLLQFVGLTTVGGPQAAALFVFAADPPLGLAWVLAMTLLNMVATVCLILPLAWRGFERLRDARFVGGLARSAERFSVRHRRFLARWGLLGLTVVTFAPIQGGGVVGASILGVILRLGLPRLLATVLSTGAVLAVAWTLFLYYTASALPSEGAAGYLPHAIVAALVLAGAVAGFRGHLGRHRFEVETIPGTPEAQRARLQAVGIDEQEVVLHADLRQVCVRLGIPPTDLVRARNTAELLRLDNLPPAAAERLTAVGLASIRELTVAPAKLVRDALAEAARPGFRLPALKEIEAWQDEARRFDAAFHVQVNEHARKPRTRKRKAGEPKAGEPKAGEAKAGKRAGRTSTARKRRAQLRPRQGR